MSLFNVSIKEKTKKESDLLSLVYNELTQSKEYESTKDKNSFLIEKCNLDTILRFNTKANISSSELELNAELHDTLILTILVILSILFTSGIGVIFIVAFAYLQKRKADAYLKELIKNKTLIQ